MLFVLIGFVSFEDGFLATKPQITTLHDALIFLTNL